MQHCIFAVTDVFVFGELPEALILACTELEQEAALGKIKLCGLSRPCDIEAANQLTPDFSGFVFAKKSRRYVAPEKAKALREKLNPAIKAVGVFVREEPEAIAGLLNDGIIDLPSSTAATMKRISRGFGR